MVKCLNISVLYMKNLIHKTKLILICIMYNFFSFCYEFNIVDIDYIDPIIKDETIEKVLDELDKENLEILLIQICSR